MPPKYALVLVFLQSSDFLAPWEKTVVQNKAAATTRILLLQIFASPLKTEAAGDHSSPAAWQLDQPVCFLP
jgi:hypothetical protein